MEVPIISGEGVQVHCDSFLIQKQDRYSRGAWMISMFGAGVALQSIYASLQTGQRVKCVMPSGERIDLWLHTWNTKFHAIVKRVPGQMFQHMIVWPEIASQRSGESRFILSGVEGTDFQKMLYSFLIKRVEIPVHRSWKQWLWSLFKKEEWLTDLRSHGWLRGFYVDGYDYRLEEKVVEAVKSGEIGVPGDASS